MLLSLKQQLDETAEVMAKRALPPTIEPESDFAQELADHIKEWLITFDDDFLDERLAIWLGEEGKQ
jgi:hypothetical protein